MSGTTSSAIVIGCKLANGVILRLKSKPGVEYKLNGANAARVIGGYGLTTIPSDFWDAWVKEKAGFPPLENNLIFAQPTVAKAEGQAKEQEEAKAGTEPLDPQKPAPGITPAK